MPLFYTVPHLCLQYSTLSYQEFGSIYMSLYLYVRSEKEKNSKKEEKKRDYVVCDLIIETKQSLLTQNDVHLFSFRPK